MGICESDLILYRINVIRAATIKFKIHFVRPFPRAINSPDLIFHISKAGITDSCRYFTSIALRTKPSKKVEFIGNFKLLQYQFGDCVVQISGRSYGVELSITTHLVA